ncbi:MAG TPA: hypothetical protein VES61_09060 [Gaiellaceae bacterium]|nr:hypothetical protein [Gaiellaceae bacterium]
MRRVMTGLLLMLMAAALASPAAAKEANVELGSTPAGLGPGDPWNLDILVFADPGVLAKADPPVVTIRNSAGEETRFPAEPFDKNPATYKATVVFPEEGTWSYEVYDSATGRTYEYDPVVIQAPAVAPTAGGAGDSQPVSAAVSDDGFPLWPVLVGSFGLALVAAGLTVFLRRHRPPATQAR